MRLMAHNGVVVDAMGAAVPRLLEAGFTPVREASPAKDAPKDATTRKRRTTKK